ncbi:MAG: FtsX-like permease family protein [Nitrospinaceae bacterium]|nr:FtsX-like permease family protein [Nitrospinaceae bacterium]NIR54334.1 FtsX-like permease family protein [Nitrospinaceae bacterium]NIS84752.1 FtsX-like permease family protein [Nitrospinaceae bacterium]NIT81553.1 FtsX-like permease family protein [Nitrospinaceae bacterium]NIU43838.1 FtsX-like permease family protein [Nitrospinaceae bacterium]
MLIWDLFLMALRSLRANKLRTFLTTLGIIIGVASVISMISLGEGARRQTLSTIAKFGTNIISVKPGEKKSRHVRTGKVETLTLEDARAIETYVTRINGVSPQAFQSGQLKYGNKNTSSTVRGTGKDYDWMANFQLARGRFFGEEEIRGSRKVCVLGATVVKNLFGSIDPIGKTLKLDGHNYLVIGTMVAKGALSWFDPDDQVFIPITTAQKRLFGIKHIHSIDIQARQMNDIETIKNEIEVLLRDRHKIPEGEKNDFYVQNSAEWLSSWGQAAKTFQYLLGGIAAISLLVGGIGIMNIMLVSVTERTREIGIRIAIGAKKREIRKQFLIESVVISFLGGGIGIALGIFISRFVSKIGGLETIVSLSSILLAFGFSVGIGVFFGFYPANKAANLNPIDALRYE